MASRKVKNVGDVGDVGDDEEITRIEAELQRINIEIQQINQEIQDIERNSLDKMYEEQQKLYNELTEIEDDIAKYYRLQEIPEAIQSTKEQTIKNIDVVSKRKTFQDDLSFISDNLADYLYNIQPEKHLSAQQIRTRISTLIREKHTRKFIDIIITKSIFNTVIDEVVQNINEYSDKIIPFEEWMRKTYSEKPHYFKELVDLKLINNPFHFIVNHNNKSLNC